MAYLEEKLTQVGLVGKLVRQQKIQRLSQLSGLVSRIQMDELLEEDDHYPLKPVVVAP